MRRSRSSRRWLVGVLLALFAVLGAAACPAHALDWEWYVGGFVGGAFPRNDDFRHTETGQEVGGPTISTQEVSVREATFLSSPVVGAKAGVCPGLFPNVCGELEFDHFNPTLDSQNTQGQLTSLVTGQPPQTQNIGFTGKIDLSVWNVGLNLIGRLPFLKETGYPLGGRLHLYGGAGPAFVWTQARNQCNTSGGAPFCGGSDTDFSVGVQALGGLKFFITKNLAVFGEYKFKHWTSEFKFSGIGSVTSGGTTTTFDVTSKVKDLDFNTNLFYIGLALHF